MGENWFGGESRGTKKCGRTKKGKKCKKEKKCKKPCKKPKKRYSCPKEEKCATPRKTVCFAPPACGTGCGFGTASSFGSGSSFGLGSGFGTGFGTGFGCAPDFGCAPKDDCGKQDGFNPCCFAGASAQTATIGPDVVAPGPIPFSVPQLVTCVASTDGKVWTILKPGEYRYDYDVYFRAAIGTTVTVYLTVNGIPVPGSQVLVTGGGTGDEGILLNAERFGRLCLRCGDRVAVEFTTDPAGGTIEIEDGPPTGTQVSLFNLQQVSACA